MESPLLSSSVLRGDSGFTPNSWRRLPGGRLTDFSPIRLSQRGDLFPIHRDFIVQYRYMLYRLLSGHPFQVRIV
jgi:hypothetical protein